MHARLVKAVPDHPELTFHDLYEAYPRLDIEVRREQALLSGHDVIVLQFPFYWYSTPPMLKQWQDLVLEHGWAYGSKGTALKGKTLLCAMSTGGRSDAYRPEGFNRFSVRQLLAPIEQTARLCGMRFLPPWLVSGTHRMLDADIDAAGREYAALLRGLLADRLATDESSLAEADALNEFVADWPPEADA